MSTPIFTPLSGNTVSQLRAGDRVTLTGTIYAASETAYRRLMEATRRGEALPIDLEGQVICCLDRPVQQNGSALEITLANGSGLDKHAPHLLAEGVRGIIGQGVNSATTKYTYRKYRAVQFSPIGELAEHVEAAKVAASDGPDEIVALTLKGFPAVVANDVYGGETTERTE